MATDETRAEAAHPGTDPARLQELTNDPELWPLIAANPNAYDSLLSWLDQVGGPDVKAALAARGGAIAPTAVAPVVPQTPPAGEQQPMGLPQPGGYPAPGTAPTGNGGGSSNKVLWIVLGIVVFLLVGSGIGVGVWALTKDDDKDDKKSSQEDDTKKDEDDDKKSDDEDDDKKKDDDDKKDTKSGDIDCDDLEDLYDAAGELTMYYPGLDDESVLADAVEVIEQFEDHDNADIADAVDTLLDFADYVAETGDGSAGDEWSDAVDAEFALNDLLYEEC